MAKIVGWGGVIVALTLPFIFQTTFYPFFRFGMFAEPVRSDIQEERFILMRTSASGKITPYVPENVGIGKNKLDYLLRNYYYRSETQQLIQHLQALLPDSVLENPIKVMRIVGHDTIVVGEITRL